ncbi:uncharacterized protein [Zea mays]|nr:uncharacterized protein LOC103650381 isoform X2 [Zea mays]|eukprot:XP_023157744.1 uncharacterized protein LOC103650381 isoform X2 [Zea mays]
MDLGIRFSKRVRAGEDTKGKQLDRMTKVMQRRLSIAVEEGKKRPHEPVQAAKFASEAGIIIRETMPILTRWKDYKDDQKYYNSFVSQLNGRLSVNTKDKATKEACTDMLHSAEISEKNKQNRSQVKFHQATGSHCYVAHLHAYSHMEALRAEPVAEGEMPASSVHLVSKVLSQSSSHHFLKSVGIKTSASSKSSSSNQSELPEQLAAEATVAVQGELDQLKKKCEEAKEQQARTQREFEEYKKITEKNNKEMEETNVLIKKLLPLHGNASSST